MAEHALCDPGEENEADDRTQERKEPQPIFVGSPKADRKLLGEEESRRGDLIPVERAKQELSDGA